MGLSWVETQGKWGPWRPEAESWDHWAGSVRAATSSSFLWPPSVHLARGTWCTCVECLLV